MQIDLPQSEQQRLTLLATEAGYTDVERFVTEHVRALAQQPSSVELAPLSQAELGASLALIDKSVAELTGDGGLSLEEAKRRSGERLRELLR